MVAINMNLTPSKVIRKETCLWVRSPSKLSKDLGLKRCLNILKREEFLKIKNSAKVKYGGVHYKTYDGCCTKQWVKILKVKWTSPILRNRFTCQTFYNMAFFNEKWCESWGA
jgi:hypothetical protein